ncbi:Gp49 family protein [Lactiplantibacillus paraxiangfangensis]|uniref:Gp49 family protein n=1 Tax=Lactiplantibacillus paraxiangfangensis TaxID=3076224 RepID=UPI0030C67466
MQTKVSESTVEGILNNSQIEAKTMFNKVTVVTAKLPNGFVLVESSGAVSEENYDFEMGKTICLERIKNKIWELEGYRLASILADKD